MNEEYLNEHEDDTTSVGGEHQNDGSFDNVDDNHTHVPHVGESFIHEDNLSSMMDTLRHKIAEKEAKVSEFNHETPSTQTQKEESTQINHTRGSVPVELEEISLGSSVSFTGHTEDQKNSEASKFQDELSSAHVYVSNISKSDLWGGFDDYTTSKIKDAINSARSDGRISDSTYQKLMTDLKKASHYA